MIVVTESAAEAMARFVSASKAPEGGVRIAVEDGGCSGLKYKMSVVATATNEDVVVTEGSARVFVDAESATVLDGVTVDYVDGLDGSGFKFQNPNAKAACNCGKSFSC